MKNVGKIVIEGRQARGLSRLKFAILAGLTEPVIQGIETNLHKPQYLSLVKIALFLELDPSSLIEWNDVGKERQKFPLLILTAQAKKGMTNNALAKSVGVSQQTISFYHIGKTQPESLAVIQKIAEALDIDVEVLKSAWCWKKLDQASREYKDGLYCSRCHYVKDKNEFHNYGSGYFSTCKKCREESRQKKLAESTKN
jgi:transcriptional regulator with XRE-family HTH domain